MFEEMDKCVNDFMETVDNVVKKDSHQVVELFGKRLRIVEDDGGSCIGCFFYKHFDCDEFGVRPCKDANGNMKRHFEEVKE